MSKIEKALSRARQATGSGLIPAAAARPAGIPRAVGDEPARAPVASGGALTPAVSDAATIARMKESALRNHRELAEQHIITQVGSENATLHAFREIRTRILQHAKGRSGIVLVTSVVGGSGSSFVALNLGAAFAFDSGRTALVLDCNLRDPSLHKLFGDQQRLGVTDYLDDPGLDVAEIIHPVGIERLRVVPAGVRRDSVREYFTSQRAKQLLLGVRNRYAERFIIVDAPPVTESADTQILAELCDYILLVVPYGRVTVAQVDACVTALNSQKLIGLVFNDEPQVPVYQWRDAFRQAAACVQSLFSRVGRGQSRSKTGIADARSSS